MTIQAEVHHLVLNVRHLERVVNSEKFKALYATLTQGDKDYVSKLIKDISTEKLVEWIDSRLVKELGEMSSRELREQARKLCIPGYSLMSKETLIREILNEQARLRCTARQTVGVESNPGLLPEQGKA